VTDEESTDERSWIADKRDFVADYRDDIAFERDSVADARDAVAERRDEITDQREAALDEWESRLEQRAVDLGLQRDGPAAKPEDLTTQRAEAKRARDEQRQLRQDRQIAREVAAAARIEATKLRQAAAPHTGLALAFAEIAQHLYLADTSDELLTRVAITAVAAIEGCDLASITVKENGAFRTIASTGKAASDVDEAQYTTGEGPCIDAIEAPLVFAGRFPDERWPNLGSRPLDCGVLSAASYRLTATGELTDSSLVGSLNSYSSNPDAFVEEARQVGLILAAHASVAAAVVGERTSLEQMGRQLHEALSSRDVIGQAKGMLMERLGIGPEEAFDALRRSSQYLNVKLREIAEKLTQTGEFAEPA
jgi:hypothetical protein